MKNFNGDDVLQARIEDPEAAFAFAFRGKVPDDGVWQSESAEDIAAARMVLGYIMVKTADPEIKPLLQLLLDDMDACMRRHEPLPVITDEALEAALAQIAVPFTKDIYGIGKVVNILKARTTEG